MAKQGFRKAQIVGSIPTLGSEYYLLIMIFLILIFLILILLFSIVIHEVAHGEMAYILGDRTAADRGRLSLNPIKHLDLFGSIILPSVLILFSLATHGQGIIFGWAKPVPVNPNNFSDKKYGELKVALAGPLANIIVALVFGLLLRFIPLNGNSFAQGLEVIFSYIVWINLILGLFNLIPIPPLDGSHILFALWPGGRELKIMLYEYGWFILLFIIFFAFQWFIVLVNFVFKLIVGVPFF